MPRSLQELLNFADQFEKIAVDVDQPPEFKNDWETWLKMQSPETKRDLPHHKDDPEEFEPGEVVIDDLPFTREVAEGIRSERPETLILDPKHMAEFDADDNDLDVVQPHEFDDDYQTWLSMKDPEHQSEEEKLLDLTMDPTELKFFLNQKGKGKKHELSHADDDEARLGIAGVDPFGFDLEDGEKLEKCEECKEGYNGDKFCHKCKGSGLKHVKSASQALVVIAKGKEKKHKLDPKAKVRNRGTVCVPASQAKDHKDHFPINDIDQARNALSRVHQYSSVPEWYKGSLKGLQALVSRKVHSKYPAIGKDDKKKKKSSADYLLSKYGEPSVNDLIKRAQNLSGWVALLKNYPNVSAAMNDLSEAVKMYAFDQFPPGSEDDDKVRELILKQADLFSKIHPEMTAIDQELEAMAVPRYNLQKSASVEGAVAFLNGCSSTTEALRDIAKAQFDLAGQDIDSMPEPPATPFSPEDSWKDEHASWQETKKLHDMIMEFANKLEVEEQKTW